MLPLRNTFSIFVCLGWLFCLASPDLGFSDQASECARSYSVLEAQYRFRDFWKRFPDKSRVQLDQPSPEFHAANMNRLFEGQVPKASLRVLNLKNVLEQPGLSTRLAERLPVLRTAVSTDRNFLEFTDLRGQKYYYRVTQDPDSEHYLLRLESDASSYYGLFPTPYLKSKRLPLSFDFREGSIDELAQRLVTNQSKSNPRVDANKYMISILREGRLFETKDIENLNLLMAFDDVPIGQVKDPIVRQMLGVIRGTSRTFSVGGKSVDVDLRSAQVMLSGGVFLYPAEMVPISITEWVAKVNAIKPGESLRRIASLAKDFLLIHPFADGNGRVARVFLDAMLMKAGYPPLPASEATTRKLLFQSSDDSVAEFLRLYDNAKLLGARSTPQSFSGPERNLMLARRAVDEVTGLRRNLLPPRFSSSSPSRPSAWARGGDLYTLDAQSPAWKNMTDDEMIGPNRHEAGHLIFGRNMDALSKRWRRLANDFFVDYRRQFKRPSATYWNPIKKNRLLNSDTKFQKRFEEAKNAYLVTRAYDELMADFAEAILSGSPSKGIEDLRRMWSFTPSFDVNRPSFQLRRWDNPLEGSAAVAWQKMVRDKKNGEVSYIYFAPIRKVLWDRVTEARARGVEKDVIYEKVFHLMRNHFESLGDGLEKGTLDPVSVNGSLKRMIQEMVL